MIIFMKLYEIIKKHPKILKISLLVSPFLVYLFISIIFFAPNNFSSLSNSIINNGSDPQTFIWFINWWTYSIMHGLNPFFTKFIWAPNGFNLAWSTSIPSISLAMTPITLIWGAVMSFNILVILTPVLSSVTCFYLVYYISKKYLPSLFAGYIFGFSSYELGQLLGHTNLDVTFIIPLLILLFLLRINNKINRLWYLIFIAIMLAIEFGISIEIFATFLMFSTLAIIIFYYYSNINIRKKILLTSLETISAIGLSLIILTPYLYFMIKNYKDASSAKNSAILFSSDLLNFIIPTPITQLGHNIFSKISSHFVGNFSEEGSYLGVPFISILIYITIKLWKKTHIKALSILFLIITIFTLGPKLHINGSLTKIYLPWLAGTYLPLIKAALPDRFSLYLFLILAIIIGMWLSIKTTKKKSLIKYSIIIIAIICSGSMINRSGFLTLYWC